MPKWMVDQIIVLGCMVSIHSLQTILVVIVAHLYFCRQMKAKISVINVITVLFLTANLTRNDERSQKNGF